MNQTTLSAKIEEIAALCRNYTETKEVADYFVNAMKSPHGSEEYQMLLRAADGNESQVTAAVGFALCNLQQEEEKIRKAIMAAYCELDLNKATARDMLVGYYVDDDGIATYPPDKDGNRKKVLVNGKPEQAPGEFLKFHPEALQRYDKYDPISDADGTTQKRFYCELKDQEGHFIARVYKDDPIAMGTLIKLVVIDSLVN